MMVGILTPLTRTYPCPQPQFQVSQILPCSNPCSPVMTLLPLQLEGNHLNAELGTSCQALPTHLLILWVFGILG